MKFYFILQLLFVNFFFEIKLLSKTNLCTKLFSNSYYYFWIIINDNKETHIQIFCLTDFNFIRCERNSEDGNNIYNILTNVRYY